MLFWYAGGRWRCICWWCLEDVWEPQEPHSADANWIQVDPFPGLSNLIDCQVKGVQANARRNEMKGVQVEDLSVLCLQRRLGLSKLCGTQRFTAFEFYEELLFFLFLGMTGMAAHQLFRRLYGKCGLVQPYRSKAEWQVVRARHGKTKWIQVVVEIILEIEI